MPDLPTGEPECDSDGGYDGEHDVRSYEQVTDGTQVGAEGGEVMGVFVAEAPCPCPVTFKQLDAGGVTLVISVPLLAGVGRDATRLHPAARHVPGRAVA